MALSIKLLINSVDLTAKLIERSWTIDDNEGDVIDTIELELDDQDRTLDILDGQELIVEKDGDVNTRYFAGLVAEVRIEPFGVGRRWFITAQDWKMILDRSYFTKEWTNTNDSTIIDEAFTEAGATEFDSTTLVQTGRSIDRLVFRAASLRQLLSTISEITGFIWDVDKFKKVVYRPEGDERSSFDLSDDPDDVTTFPYRDIARVKEIGQFNAVEVRGGRKLTEVTDTYSGDGTRTKFNLRVDGIVSGRDYHLIIQGPTGSTLGFPTIERNTGTDGTPTWTAQTVGLEGQDTGKDVNWNPKAEHVIWASAPPNFANNSWRIKGQYVGYVVWYDRDEDAIALSGREFKKVIYVPEVETDDQAADIAAAFMREQGPKDRLILSFENDGLEIGQYIAVTSTNLGITAALFKTHQLSIRLLGGTVAEYRAVVGSGSHTFAHILHEIRRKAGRIDRLEAEGVVTIRRINEEIQLAIEVVNVARGPDYFCDPGDLRDNLNTNPSFEDSLNNWTESISGSVTGTTSRSDAQQKYGLFSLFCEVTASTGTGQATRYFEMDAAPGDVISMSVQVHAPVLTNGYANFLLQFLDAGFGVLASHELRQNVVTSDFTELKVENRTAPASTAKIRVWLQAVATAAAADIDAYFDGILLEKATSVGAYFDGHEANGFWQGAENESASILDVDGDTILPDFWKVAA